MFRYAYRAIYLVFAVVLASPLALAQVAVDPAPQAAAGNPIKFEVVSIRPYKVNISYGPGFTDDGFIVHGESPEAMLWGVCACKRIEGMPDWGEDRGLRNLGEGRRCRCGAMEDAERQDKDLALQALLEHRLQMKSHHETRVMPGFRLVVAKGGPMFKESVPGDLYSGGPKGGPRRAVAGDGADKSRRDDRPARLHGGVGDILSMPAGRPVMDQTGLKGFYDFKITVQPPDPSTAADSGMPASEPSPFTMVQEAIQEQLGLKLESGVKVPVEYLVIDHIERPTGN